MKSEVYKIKVDTADELLASILVAAGCVKKREDQLRRTTRDLHTRVAKCTEVDCGILGTFNNNNNNNIYLLQLGCHPVAVVILHVHKT
jgi:hypothetical protein